MNWFTPIQRTELLQSSRGQLPIQGSRWWAGLGGPSYHGVPWTSTHLNKLRMWFQLPTRLWSHPTNWVRLKKWEFTSSHGIIYCWTFCFILEDGRYKQYVLPLFSLYAPCSFFMPSVLPQTLNSDNPSMTTTSSCHSRQICSSISPRPAIPSPALLSFSSLSS